MKNITVVLFCAFSLCISCLLWAERERDQSLVSALELKGVVDEIASNGSYIILLEDIGKGKTKEIKINTTKEWIDDNNLEESDSVMILVEKANNKLMAVEVEFIDFDDNNQEIGASEDDEQEVEDETDQDSEMEYEIEPKYEDERKIDSEFNKTY
ncbi:MAG: hypothetical protein ABII27_06820 [bacterium]